MLASTSLKKLVVYAVYLAQHLAASALLAHAELVIHCRNVECGLEHAQIGQHTEVGNAYVCGYRSLEVHTHKLHVVFHTTCLIVICFLSE